MVSSDVSIRVLSDEEIREVIGKIFRCPSGHEGPHKSVPNGGNEPIYHCEKCNKNFSEGGIGTYFL